MTATTYALGLGAFIKSEANGHQSRDTITIASGSGLLKSGTVLGKITVGGNFAPYNNDATNGTEAAAAILLEDVDATSTAVKTVGIARLAEVYTERLAWGATGTDADDKAAALADLAAKFVIAR